MIKYPHAINTCTLLVYKEGGYAVSDQYYIVKKEVVPEIYSKIIQVKKLLRSGGTHSINEAVKIVGISRGAFYKYKDSIYLESELGRKCITTLSLVLLHAPGVLSKILNVIAQESGNILTINQNIPIHDIANVTISLEDGTSPVDIDALIVSIKQVEGVNDVVILAKQ